MSDVEKEHARLHRQEFLERVAKDRDGDYVAIVAIGSRDSRIPVVVRHLVMHPRQIGAEAVPSGTDLAVEIVDGDRTFVTRRHPSTDGGG
jgi:hypothetical protein